MAWSICFLLGYLGPQAEGVRGLVASHGFVIEVSWGALQSLGCCEGTQ